MSINQVAATIFTTGIRCQMAVQQQRRSFYSEFKTTLGAVNASSLRCRLRSSVIYLPLQAAVECFNWVHGIRHRNTANITLTDRNPTKEEETFRGPGLMSQGEQCFRENMVSD